MPIFAEVSRESWLGIVYLIFVSSYKISIIGVCFGIRDNQSRLGEKIEHFTWLEILQEPNIQLPAVCIFWFDAISNRAAVVRSHDRHLVWQTFMRAQSTWHAAWCHCKLVCTLLLIDASLSLTDLTSQRALHPWHLKTFETGDTEADISSWSLSVLPERPDRVIFSWQTQIGSQSCYVPCLL